MKSYPSSELRNVCDEQNSEVEPAEEGMDLLQQMLDRRWDSSFGPSMFHSVTLECIWRLFHLRKFLVM